MRSKILPPWGHFSGAPPRLAYCLETLNCAGGGAGRATRFACVTAPLPRSSPSQAIDIEVAGLSNMEACKAESAMMQSFAPFSWISDVTRCDTTPSWTQDVLKHMLSAPYTSCILEFHRTRGGKSTTAHESSACSHPVRAATSSRLTAARQIFDAEFRLAWQVSPHATQQRNPA
jgi:hypothetical protein